MSHHIAFFPKYHMAQGMVTILPLSGETTGMHPTGRIHHLDFVLIREYLLVDKTPSWGLHTFAINVAVVTVCVFFLCFSL